MWRLIAVWLVAIAWSTCGWAGAAEDCNQEDDLDLSISGCTELINSGPAQAHVYNSRGNAYRNKGDFDRAIADYTKVIDLDIPAWVPVAYYFRGFSYRKKGDFDRAIADLNKAIELEPKSARNYNN